MRSLLDVLPPREPAAQTPGASEAHLVREGQAAQFRHLNANACRADCALVWGVGGAVMVAAGTVAMALSFSGILHAGPMAAWSTASQIGYLFGGSASVGVGTSTVVLAALNRQRPRPAAQPDETVFTPPPAQMMRATPRDIALVIQPNGAITLGLDATPRPPEAGA